MGRINRWWRRRPITYGWLWVQLWVSDRRATRRQRARYGTYGAALRGSFDHQFARDIVRQSGRWEW